MVTDHAPLPMCLTNQHLTPRSRHIVSFGEATEMLVDAILAERAEMKTLGYDTSPDLLMLEHTAAETLIRLVRAARAKEGR